jgi:hypothetical protein
MAFLLARSAADLVDPWVELNRTEGLRTGLRVVAILAALRGAARDAWMKAVRSIVEADKEFAALNMNIVVEQSVICPTMTPGGIRVTCNGLMFTRMRRCLGSSD